MATIDKLALTCRLLYDERVLEQRKEIEMLKVKLFLRDYTSSNMHSILRDLNQKNTKCVCRYCGNARRTVFETVDREAECTFSPWLDKVLKERGLLVLRQTKHPAGGRDYDIGPYVDDENLSQFAYTFNFSNEDCHLVETQKDKPHQIPEIHIFHQEVDPYARWENISIGRRLWDVESMNDKGVIQFAKVFSDSWERLSSPPTPPLSPMAAPLPPRSQPTTVGQTSLFGLSIETRFLRTLSTKQGLELQMLKDKLTRRAEYTQAVKEQLDAQDTEMQALKEQLATKDKETQELKEQLATQDLELQKAKDQLATQASKTLK
jgi:hypothetical protein